MGTDRLDFEATFELPRKGATRTMWYTLVRALYPKTDFVDDITIGVLNKELVAKNAVPRWTKYTVAHTALQTASTSNDIELFQLPAKGIIHRVMIKHSASFTGGAIATYTVSVGIAGLLTKYAGAFDVFQATGDTIYQQTGTESVTPTGLETFGSATSIRIAAVSTGANLDASTAGSVDVWILNTILP